MAGGGEGRSERGGGLEGARTCHGAYPSEAGRWWEGTYGEGERRRDCGRGGVVTGVCE
jgi:hypothetical protein